MKIDIESLLNIPMLRVKEFNLGEKEILIKCESKSPAGICPNCLESCTEVYKYYDRTIRDMPVFGKRVELQINCRQFHCPRCNRYFSERFDFVAPNKNMTIRLEEYLYKMCADISITQVSLKEDICWATVQSIYERYSSKELRKVDRFSQVRYLGIDEISIKKGKKDYACVLVDLERATVIDFLESRHKDFLVNYFNQIGADFCQQIEVLSSDMWDGFVGLVKSVFPKAINVIDRFHFFCHLNKVLDNERKALRKNEPKEEVFKHLRWPILKAPESLSKEEQDLLSKAFQKAPHLEKIYRLRNELKQIFDQPFNELQADVAIAFWQQKAMKLNNTFLNKFLKTLRNWRHLILNYFSIKISNAAVEGINNHIRSIIRRGFGYRLFDNLRTRILLECQCP